MGTQWKGALDNIAYGSNLYRRADVPRTNHFWHCLLPDKTKENYCLEDNYPTKTQAYRVILEWQSKWEWQREQLSKVRETITLEFLQRHNFRSRPKTSQYSRATPQEPLIVNQNRSNNRKPPKKYNQPATIRGFGRDDQARNSAKWHTPRRNEMKKPSYDPYGAIDV